MGPFLAACWLLVLAAVRGAHTSKCYHATHQYTELQSVQRLVLRNASGWLAWNCLVADQDVNEHYLEGGASRKATAARPQAAHRTKSQRPTRIPTSAISAATTAVAMPPDNSGLASTRRVDSGFGSCLGIGTVITRLA